MASEGRVLHPTNKQVADVRSGARDEGLRLIPKPGFAPWVVKGGQRIDPEDTMGNAASKAVGQALMTYCDANYPCLDLN